MRIFLAAVVGTLAATCVPLQPVWACDGSSVAFEDSFASLDPAWGTPYGMSTSGGHLVLAVPADAATGDPNWASHTLSQSNVYTDATVCASFKPAATSDANQTEQGLVFWGTDDNAFYVFMTSPIGSFTVQRKIAPGRWLTPLPWKEAAVVKKGFGQQQELQVTTKGSVASFYIDGTKVGELKGQPPATGSLVGLFWELPTKAPTGGVEVSGFQVKN